MSIEALRQKRAPYPFYSRKEAGEAVPQLYEETLAFGQEEIRKLKEINELLHNPMVDKLVIEGKLTLGIIKPNAHMGKGLSNDDEKAASRLLEEIGREHIVFEFSSQLTQKQIETFYADVKEKYSDVYDKPSDIKTIWEDVSEMLNSGPVTILLLYRREGNAVSWWRERMGKTHPSEADPQSIRGKYGLEENMPNNLTHGSDTVEGVKREISAVRSIVSELTERSIEVSSKFPAEQTLRQLEIIGQDQRLLSIRRLYDSGMRSESWIYAYSIGYLDSHGNLQTKLLKEKNIISMGGNLTNKARIHRHSFQKLERVGITIPTTYGVKGASLYQEFIPNDQTDEILVRLNNDSLSGRNKENMDQLIRIAAILDKEGYTTLNYIGDLIFDGDRNEFIYVDSGYDLGPSSPEPTRSGLNTLISKYSQHSEYIQKVYEEIYNGINN